MNQKEVIKANTLIAKFMGLRSFVKNNHVWIDYLGDPFKPTVERAIYNSSWEWLMPVIEKIEATEYNFKDNPLFTEPDDDIHNEVDVSFRFVIQGVECTIDFDVLPQYYGTTTNFLELYDCRKRENGSTKLDNTYLAVIEFIKWINVHCQNVSSLKNEKCGKGQNIA